ncbi:MAG TPA: hypothetical protein DCR63_05390 [Microbacterium sp.]|nr:hypothetical protein [Microbacterium sp.]
MGGAVSLALAAVFLAACTQQPAPDESPVPTAPTPSMSASATPTPTPVLLPEGSADDNLPYFTLVTQQVWGGGERMAGRAYIDALVSAGFDKSRMQVTKDQTAIGNAVDSIQFSVAWNEECLIGQAGAVFPEPVTVILPALQGGACLIGDTRPIDW